MHIAHLTSVHKRYDTRIFLKECRSLAENDFHVTLIVADGKGNEVKDSVHIVDVGASSGRLARISKAPKRVLNKALEIGADIYHLHDPELLPVGVRLKKLGKRVIFDMHENLDMDIMQKEWIPWLLRKPVSYLYHNYEKIALKKFDGLIVPQVSMKARFGAATLTEVIANFPEKFIEIDLRERVRNKYKLIYAGAISEARGAVNMLNLMTELRKINQDYTLTLAGPIDLSLLNKIKEHPAWIYVDYKGILSADELYEEYKKHSIGLILFNNVGQYFMAYSLKLFEYMQNGMLVIMPDFGDWLDFNKINAAGFNVDTINSEEIAKVIDRIEYVGLQQVSLRNISSVKNNFLWKTQSTKLINMYHEIFESQK